MFMHIFSRYICYIYCRYCIYFYHFLSLSFPSIKCVRRTSARFLKSPAIAVWVVRPKCPLIRKAVCRGVAGQAFLASASSLLICRMSTRQEEPIMRALRGAISQWLPSPQQKKCLSLSLPPPGWTPSESITLVPASWQASCIHSGSFSPVATLRWYRTPWTIHKYVPIAYQHKTQHKSKR